MAPCTKVKAKVKLKSRSSLISAAAKKKLRPSSKHQPQFLLNLDVKCHRAERLLISKKWWSWLPDWIALPADREGVQKCEEGHRLVWQAQDGRKHGACVWCGRRPVAGSRILSCGKGCWSTICTNCVDRPRLPKLEEDPLFHGPDSPALLPPSVPDLDLCMRGTMIVVPGGNYEFLVPGEGMPLAELLMRNGIRAYVLRYRLLPAHSFDEAMEDLAAAVSVVRQKHGGPVAAMGFSAGGHLVASYSLKGNAHGCSLRTGDRRRLDAQVLVYPCIDGAEWATEDCGFSALHWQSAYDKAKQSSILKGRQALLGGRGFAAPPTFMVGSTWDECTPPIENTDPYARALRRARIPCTYLRRNFGPHGFGLHGGWTSPCLTWLRSYDFGARVGKDEAV